MNDAASKEVDSEVKSFDYIAEANVTASNNYHGDKVPLHHFQGVLTNAINAIRELDRIKKTLFYGRDLPDLPGQHAIVTGCQQLPAVIDSADAKRGELLLHSIVGTATEAGEQLELLANVLFNNQTFDEVNFIEEMGDVFWYAAIGLNQVKATFGDVQQINIAKLRHRFPQKFNEYDANNRDLFGERKILEGGEVKPTADIENWSRVGDVLIGDISNHPSGESGEGRTSKIVRMDEANGICETKNTIYRLGAPEQDA